MKKKIKSPLKKRWRRELRGDKGKYLALFLFLTITIGFISGFLVADNSMKMAYDESFEKYNIEDGHFSLAVKMPDQLKKDLEGENIKIFEQFYKDEELKKAEEKEKTIRLFRPRREVNKECMMKGRMPKSKNEIVIDRLFAENNKIKTGQNLKLGGKEYKVTGFVALSDYSALFENNSDMMFNATKFSIALVTKEGFDRVDDDNLIYQYAWKEKKGKKVSSKNIEDLLKDSMVLTEYVRQKDNQAIIFTGNDMGGDKQMFLVMLYVVIVIMAFVFGVTAKSLIEQEASTIGTLRASGYTKGELLRHYMKLPVMLVFIAAIIGNILGYTWMKQIAVDMYYHSYSLTKYVTIWNSEAFLLTTLIPVMIIILVTFLMLTRLLSLPPLQFLRKELTRKKKEKAARLPEWSFMSRFRMRVILQNKMAYAVLVIGILLASLLLIFGMCMMPLMENYRDEVKSSQFSKYQYVLKAPVKTDKGGAEKYCVNTLKHKGEEDIMAYGIKRDSKYVKGIDLPGKKNEVVISSGYAEKYDIHPGDRLELEETYGKKKYRFKVAGTFDYPAALSVFMARSEFNKVFDHKAKDHGGYYTSYFNGYFSDKKLDDIDEQMVASTITLADMTLIYDQLKDSFGAILPMFRGFAVIIYILLLYLLAKMVVDKNQQSISMLKILGYPGRQAGKIYNNATAIVVVAALILTLPIAMQLMKILYYIFMKAINGWLPFYIPGWMYVLIPAIGMACYLVIHLLLSRKVSKVGLAQALKSME